MARPRDRRLRTPVRRGRGREPRPAEAHAPRPPHGPHRRGVRPRAPPLLRQRHGRGLHGRPRPLELAGREHADPGPGLLHAGPGLRPRHDHAARAGIRQRLRLGIRHAVRHRAGHLGHLPEATTAQKAGVVTIDSALTYENAAGAGTGIILSSDGTILTNNHVVSGATSIRVTVESTGKAYVGKVVGTDATNDVAVLKLEDASGLTPAKLDTDGVQVGEAVTGIGNAGGTGTLTAATGQVTALGQTITTQSEGTAAGETLTDLIQTDAAIVSGDSGGPLVDAEGEVVGIDTAASSGSAQIAGFAIPIDKAVSIAKQIESGVESGTVKIGYPAFLGVLLADGAGTVAGAPVQGVVDGSGAAKAGLAQGDVVTSVDGKAVASASELSAAISAHKPGESVELGWTTAAGAEKTGTVTLTEGPVS